MPDETTRNRARGQPRAANAPPGDVKMVNLALQGGGSHGAFTWGVIDRLLEEPRFAIEGISATSAGAMNATVFAYGMAIGGRDGAKAKLHEFWKKISDAAKSSPLQPTPWDKMTGNDALEKSPAYIIFDMLSRLMSPYQLNPMNLNPLKDVLTKVVDFSKLGPATCPVKLFLSATNVRTGRVKIFTNEEIARLGADTAMASACLPFMAQTVVIEGEPFWDGGYMGNPAIYPLIYHCDSRDVMIVHINPIIREGIPKTAGEIMNRLNELSFNSSLMREMRAIHFVSTLVDTHEVSGRPLKRMLLHAVAAEKEMSSFSVASKLNADWDFLMKLHEIGRRHADVWLAANFDKVGTESSVDIKTAYL